MFGIGLNYRNDEKYRRHCELKRRASEKSEAIYPNLYLRNTHDGNTNQRI
ncbi:hypothetical protein [Pedobacter xixiisoli]|nr:hypothetical protein [Pedobacter xixiisoli]